MFTCCMLKLTVLPLPDRLPLFVPILNPYNIIAASTESPTIASNAASAKISDPSEVNTTPGLDAASIEDHATGAGAAAVRVVPGF